MRFKRSDLIGIAVAAFVPAVLSYVLFAGWQLLHHEGTPLLGMIAGNFAVVGGIAAYGTRYLVHRRVFVGIGVAFAVCVLGVLYLQRAAMDGGLALALKWLGLLLFLALNVVLVVDLLAVAVNPYLVRRDERRAAGN